MRMIDVTRHFCNRSKLFPAYNENNKILNMKSEFGEAEFN